MRQPKSFSWMRSNGGAKLTKELLLSLLRGLLQSYFLLEQLEVSEFRSHGCWVGWDVLLWTHAAIGDTRPVHHGPCLAEVWQSPGGALPDASQRPAPDRERLVACCCGQSSAVRLRGETATSLPSCIVWFAGFLDDS